MHNIPEQFNEHFEQEDREPLEVEEEVIEDEE